VIHLDTHVVVWLYLAALHRLAPRARRALDQEDLEISPMVLLELQSLREIGRLVPAPDEILGALTSSVGLTVSRVAFEDVVQRAILQTWTRDPFDRIIASQAAVAGVCLVTADQTIRRNHPSAIWD
jgi:PIN domain nuclease of toxin-antitoxin system